MCLCPRDASQESRDSVTEERGILFLPFLFFGLGDWGRGGCVCGGQRGSSSSSISSSRGISSISSSRRISDLHQQPCLLAGLRITALKPKQTAGAGATTSELGLEVGWRNPCRVVQACIHGWVREDFDLHSSPCWWRVRGSGGCKCK